MAEAARQVSFDVGPWKATVCVPPLRRGTVHSATCEWEPGVPDRALTPAEQAQFRRGLAEAMASATDAGQMHALWRKK